MQNDLLLILSLLFGTLMLVMLGQRRRPLRLLTAGRLKLRENSNHRE